MLARADLRLQVHMMMLLLVLVLFGMNSTHYALAVISTMAANVVISQLFRISLFSISCDIHYGAFAFRLCDCGNVLGSPTTLTGRLELLAYTVHYIETKRLTSLYQLLACCLRKSRLRS